MTEAWGTRFLRLGTRRSSVASLVSTAALPFRFVLEQPPFMKYGVKNCDHLDKILGDMGIAVVRERPYRASS